MGTSPELESTMQKPSLTWFILKTEASIGERLVPVNPHPTHSCLGPMAHPPLRFLQGGGTVALDDLTVLGNHGVPWGPLSCTLTPVHCRS